MKQAEFHILDDEAPRAAFRYCVEIIEAAFKNNRKVFVHTASKKDAEYLDELLWSKDPSSFLPHLLCEEAPGVSPPIQIGFGQTPGIRPDVLINLAAESPNFYQQFGLVHEFANGTEESRELAREKFKNYRQLGYSLKHHSIEKEA